MRPSGTCVSFQALKRTHFATADVKGTLSSRTSPRHLVLDRFPWPGRRRSKEDRALECRRRSICSNMTVTTIDFRTIALRRCTSNRLLTVSSASRSPDAVPQGTARGVRLLLRKPMLALHGGQRDRRHARFLRRAGGAFSSSGRRPLWTRKPRRGEGERRRGKVASRAWHGGLRPHHRKTPQTGRVLFRFRTCRGERKARASELGSGTSAETVFAYEQLSPPACDGRIAKKSGFIVW